MLTQSSSSTVTDSIRDERSRSRSSGKGMVCSERTDTISGLIGELAFLWSLKARGFNRSDRPLRLTETKNARQFAQTVHQQNKSNNLKNSKHMCLQNLHKPSLAQRKHSRCTASRANRFSYSNSLSWLVKVRGKSELFLHTIFIVV